MIKYVEGDIFESNADALVNTVNLVGVMGKGIALQFKQRFPNNFKLYQKACKEKIIDIGKLFVTKEQNVFGQKLIINFPTKTDWKKTSEYSYIEKGLDDLVRVIGEYDIKSIAIPPLGAGNGGLNWEIVKKIIEDKLSTLPIDIFVYAPNASVIEKMKQERVQLTPARALLLYVLFDLVRHGEYVSEFSSEKVCYFLQRFGAENIFKLKFEPQYYGPYSGKVRYILNILNGSYIMGYSDMNKKPFESLSIVPDSFDDIKSFIESDKHLEEIADKTMSFLDGFYSDFGLELLSSVDYLMCNYGVISVDEIYDHLSQWSHRKGKIFNDHNFISLAKNHLIMGGFSYPMRKTAY
ncbi:MAG: macro domain-containing protein [Alphaproteobacteria bacterium]|nr:macro domain-containing protein [Alphaproteobacteria bacterium]